MLKDESKGQWLPRRSECVCICHKKAGIMHITPCCRPDVPPPAQAEASTLPGVVVARPIAEHPCYRWTGQKLSHRHWFQDNALMPTCERCGTPIDRKHNETGPVSWEPEKRREIVTLEDRHAISKAAMAALGEWLVWPDAGRDGPREVTVAQTLSFLKGLPNKLGYAASPTTPAEESGEVAQADKAAAARYLAGTMFGTSVKDCLAAWEEAENSEDGYCHPLWIVLRDHRLAASRPAVESESADRGVEGVRIPKWLAERLLDWMEAKAAMPPREALVPIGDINAFRAAIDGEPT